jgi:PAS domain S-box-containing protein
MEIKYFLSISILLQLSAAFLSFRIFPAIGRQKAWNFILLVILITTLCQLILLLQPVSLDGIFIFPELSAEQIIFTSSLLISIGIITKIRNTEKKLRKSEEKYRLFFQEDLTGDYICNADGHIIECNPAFAKIFGFDSIEEALLHPVDEFYPYPEKKENLLEQIKKGKRLEHHEMALIGKNNQTVYVITNIIGIFGKDGGFTGFKGYLFDITKLKELEEKLRQARKMQAIETMGRGIAHDLNAMLNPVMGYSELWLMKEPGAKETRNYMNQILISANRAKELLQQILTFGRQIEYSRIPVKIQSIVTECLKLIKADLPADIKIIQNIDDQCSPILAEPVQIHRLVINLCTNAYHAMEENGGVMEVHLKEIFLDDKLNSDLSEGKYLKLTISDTGHGIDQDTLGRIFDPYFTTKGTGKGSGLGLSVVHGIVRTCKGDIRVDSEPGKGSAFHVSACYREKYCR